MCFDLYGIQDFELDGGAHYMPVKKSEPKQKVDARKKRKAGIKELQRKQRKRVAQVKKAVAVAITLKTGATGIAWGVAKRAAKPVRKAVGRADKATTKAIKGLFSFGRR
jgi:hypothetical protein